MNPNGYINIQGWMITDLNLKGNELILFALIYGFSQDGESQFYGSTRYIEKALGISRVSVMSLLNKLIEKSFIVCVSQSHYIAVKKLYHQEKHAVKKLYQSGKETLPESGKETLPNINNTNNNIIIKEVNKFTPPSIDLVRDYCNERKNNINAQSFVDFYTSKGWKVGNQKMKDWKACIRTWENRNKQSSNVANVFTSDKTKDKLQKALSKVITVNT